MTKDEFVALVATRSGMTKAEAGRAVEAFCAAVSEALMKGDGVRLPGFGAFAVAERGERTGRNPRTGEAVTIPAGKVVRFSAAPRLRESLNKTATP